MSVFGSGKAKEFTFQNDMIKQFLANGWLLGTPEKYNRKLALYGEDLLEPVNGNPQWIPAPRSESGTSSAGMT